MPATVNTFLLLGTNMGDRMAQLDRSRKAIGDEIGTLRNASPVYETDAWGNENQPCYLNQVVEVATTLAPQVLLSTVNGIEKRMGRVRINKWEARVIDIDILYYADRIIDAPNLQVPHPHLPDRRFALVPLLDIAPGFIHPVLGKSTAELLEQTTDHLAVRLFNADTYEQHEL